MTQPRRRKAAPVDAKAAAAKRAQRGRALMAHHASMAMSRDVQVELVVGGRKARGWIASITNDHKPQAPESAGPSNLTLHVIEQDSGEVRRARGHMPAEVIKGARRIPLEQVSGLRSVR